MHSNEIKILHCADLHLGAEFSSLGNKASQRKREGFQVFEDIVSLCKEESVEFLLIAGDLFDHLHIDSQIITEVIDQFAGIPDTVVAIAPGNHDPLSIDGKGIVLECKLKGAVSPANIADFTDHMIDGSITHAPRLGCAI